MKHLTTTIEDKVAAGGEAFKQYVLKVYKTPWHTLSDETLHQALKDFKKGKIKHLGKEPIEIAKLIKRYPEKETEYDKKLEKEYWSFEWTDGTKGEGSLYQSQIQSVKKKDTFKITGEQLRDYWGSGKPLIVGKNKYSVHRMSYGDYFLEPFGKERGETEGLPPGTIWLEKIDPKRNIYGIFTHLS